MAERGLGWIMGLWKVVDERLRKLNKTLKTVLRLVRFAVFFLILLLLASWTLAALVIWYPQYSAYFYLGSIVILSIGLIPWIVLVSLPLKAKSVTRLIDQGYPENAREMAIRVMAQKLHDESIHTEELLFDTAVNEGKKYIRRMQERDAEKHRDD